MADSGGASSAHVSDAVHHVREADALANGTSRTMHNPLADDNTGPEMTSDDRVEANATTQKSTDDAQATLPGLVTKFQGD